MSEPKQNRPGSKGRRPLESRSPQPAKTEDSVDILEELFQVSAATGGSQEAIEEALRKEAFGFGASALEGPEKEALETRLAELALMAREAWLCGQGSKIAFEGGLEKRLTRVPWASRLLKFLYGPKPESV
ncbi:MAG: hypothetical protein LBF38_05340 [Deltaproteobacteria bacterium]|jgi:hypothetical protein|nr:hypothetical protein [Deltaproteobacteria bacterium]